MTVPFLNMSDTMGVISGAVTPGFCGDHDPQSLVFCVILFGPGTTVPVILSTSLVGKIL
jgi:hypothetical protein